MIDLPINQIIQGDCLEKLKEFPNESVNCCVTSPPYWALRDYGVEGQLGLEPTFQEYINKLCDIFDEVKRVLRKDGTCWVNIGDTYGGSGMGTWKSNSSPMGKQVYAMTYGKNMSARMKGKDFDKSLCNIPARFSIEMQNRGWILRNVIIWHKPNCMPCSVKDRFTVDFEYLFFFVKSKKYWFETQYEKLSESSLKDPLLDKGREEHIGKSATKNYGCNATTINSQGRNKRTVWTITTKPFKEAHFATYPEELCYVPIKAGCPIGGTILDPFFGAGTTGLVALKQNKKFIGIELNPEYIEIAKKRLQPYLEQEKLI